MKKGSILLKNFAAGRRALFKRILVYCGTAIAVYQFITMIIDESSVNALLCGSGIFTGYFKPVLENVLIYLAIAVILAILFQASFSKYSRRISGTDITVSVVIGDIFDCHGDIVVPSNNLFAYEKDIISDKSIQYQLTEKCSDKNSSGEEFIGAQICAALEAPEYRAARQGDEQQLIDGKEYSIYPYGIMLPLKLRLGKADRHFYLLSMSGIVSKGCPTVNNKLLLGSVDGMWEYVKRNKVHSDTLVVPVMGTGAAKMVEKPKQVIARYILKTFADNAQDRLGIKKLVLCVYPGDYLDNEIDMEVLRSYIDYLCRFPNSEFNVE